MKDTFYSLVTRNFWLKFFSIALATVIWLAIHYGIRNEISISQLNINNLLAQEYIRVPVTIIPARADLQVTPSEVVLIAVGEKTALRKAAQSGIRAYIDLSRQTPGDGGIEEVRAEVPPGVNVLEINPATVTVQQVRK